MAETFKKLQALADRPFAVGFRLADGEPSVRRVRVAGVSGTRRKTAGNSGELTSPG